MTRKECADLCNKFISDSESRGFKITETFEDARDLQHSVLFAKYFANAEAISDSEWQESLNHEAFKVGIDLITNSPYLKV